MGRINRQRLESLLTDLRHVCRRLQRSPGFAVSVVLTLAIGIGAIDPVEALRAE